jgi:hypothetical protein
MKRLLSGIAIGALMTAGAWTVSAQNERAMHPRIAAAIEAIKDAKAYMQAAPHDFGGHREAALKASDAAIRQLNLALAYREVKDRR